VRLDLQRAKYQQGSPAVTPVADMSAINAKAPASVRSYAELLKNLMNKT
jgi:hypothetical protein